MSVNDLSGKFLKNCAFILADTSGTSTIIKNELKSHYFFLLKYQKTTQCDEELARKLSELTSVGVSFKNDFYQLNQKPGFCEAQDKGSKEPSSGEKVPRQCCGTFPNA